jgi:hypothetical protein
MSLSSLLMSKASTNQHESSSDGFLLRLIFNPENGGVMFPLVINR